MADRYGAFRLNFEQQQRRAKELLKAARAGDPVAAARFKSTTPKLAEAQFLIARELRFESWAALKRHIAAMTLERQAMKVSVLDSDVRTMHIRCGSDLKVPLQEAGFCGDFYEHSYPYLIGPVREGVDCLQQRARFLVDTYGDSHDPPLTYEPTLRAAGSIAPAVDDPQTGRLRAVGTRRQRLARVGQPGSSCAHGYHA